MSSANQTYYAVKGSGDLVWQASSYYAAAGYWTANMQDGPYSLECVVEIVDTTSDQIIVGISELTGSKKLVLSVTTGQLCAIGVNGSDYYNSVMVPGGIKKKLHIITTYDYGDNAPLIYVNGALMTDDDGVNSVYIEADGVFFIGAKDGLLTYKCVAGTKINLVRGYGAALTQGQVTTNYNSDSVQDKLP